jgi:ADP-dependent NAD(P)H-hydrate dehydratase / NAD(P)H-hydrate epimerase
MKAEELTLKQISKLLTKRPADSHKGRFGHLIVVAGSRGMSGAAALAGWAALKAGAGLVTAGAPASEQRLIAGARPELLSAPLTETAEGTLHPRAVSDVAAVIRDRKIDAMALGPGLSVHPRTVEAVLDILTEIRLPTVLDADGLNALGAVDRKTVAALFKKRSSPTILTPHPGEMARLLRTTTARVQKARLASAVELARELGAVCILKGHQTIVSDGRSAYVNPTGNPGLAKGGTGDVLTGMLGGLWAQRPDAGWALPAACLAVYLHGLAADLAVEEKTEHCLLASDVIEALPRAFQKTAKA